ADKRKKVGDRAEQSSGVGERTQNNYLTDPLPVKTGKLARKRQVRVGANSYFGRSRGLGVSDFGGRDGLRHSDFRLGFNRGGIDLVGRQKNGFAVNALLDLLRHDSIEFDPGAKHGECVLIIVAARLKQDRREGELKQLSTEDRKPLSLLLADGDSAGGGDLGDHGGF